MTRIGLIGIAGAAGALARYAIGVALGGRLYPYGTLAINVIGSFLLGLLLGGPGASRWSETTTLALGVGFLGAFTTFSTFTNETMDLLRDGRPTAGVRVRVALVGARAGGGGDRLDRRPGRHVIHRSVRRDRAL